MPIVVCKVIAGFIAGALAVLIFHQSMYLLIQYLFKMQMLGPPAPTGTPWSMAPDPAAHNLPRVLNLAFWGGLWGILFAFLIDRLPGPDAIRGLLFGIVFPMLLGSWLIVAMIKGTPLFSNAFAKGFNPAALRNGFLLNGFAFGLGVGVIYPIVIRMFSSRSARATS